MYIKKIESNQGCQHKLNAPIIVVGSYIAIIFCHKIEILAIFTLKVGRKPIVLTFYEFIINIYLSFSRLDCCQYFRK